MNFIYTVKPRLEIGCYSLGYGFQICWELGLIIPRIVVEVK